MMTAEECDIAMATFVLLHPEQAGPFGPTTLSGLYKVLADAYLKEHDEQARVTMERSKPIDREWLLSIGFKTEPRRGEIGDDVLLDRLQLWEFSPSVWLVAGCDRHELQTRGQVLDLLSAFGIQTKGTE